MEVLNKILILKNYSRLIKDSGILLVGTVLGFIFNYIFQVFMGRSLGPEGYGILSTLFAFLYIVQMMSETIRTTAANFTAKFVKAGELGKVRYKFDALMNWIFTYGLIAFAVYILFIPLFKHYTRIYDNTAFILLGVVGLVSLVGALYAGLFNGIQDFFNQAFINTLNTFIKLIAGLSLVYLGYNYLGGVVAVLIGGFIGLIISNYIFNKKVSKDVEEFEIKSLFEYSTPVFFSTIFFSLIFTIDVIILKSMFSSHEVGLYAAATMIGKLFFFGSGIILNLVFPKFSGEKNQLKLKRMLDISTGLILVGGVFFSLFFYLFSDLIIKIIYGSDYMTIAPLLWIFCMIFVFYSINNIFIKFYYSRHKFNYANFAIIFLILEVIGLYLFNDSLYEVVMFLLMLNFIYFCVNLILRHRVFKNAR